MIAPALALLGIAGAVLGWIVDPARFLHAWLAAVVAWAGWPLGSLALLMVHALTGGRWGVALRPALVAGVSTLPLLLLAAVPVALGLATLYPWARADVPNALYLNVPFFAARSALYVLTWFGLAAAAVVLLRRGERLAGLAAPGLIGLAVTMTFAAIDSTMSLDPAFNSSIYGLVATAAAALTALAIATRRSVQGAAREVVADFDRLLLGLVVLWAYLAFMQFLIVWEGDLADEAAWYRLRDHGVWAWLIGIVVAGQFVLPFALLGIPSIKRSRIGISAIALLLVSAEVVRAWWLVLPAGGHAPGWVEVACVMALFGAGAAVAARVHVGEVHLA